MLFPDSNIHSNVELTVIVTLSGLLTNPSSFVTTSSNTIVSWRRVSGAVKVGFTTEGSLRVTDDPCV